MLGDKQGSDPYLFVATGTAVQTASGWQIQLNSHSGVVPFTLLLELQCNAAMLLQRKINIVAKENVHKSKAKFVSYPGNKVQIQGQVTITTHPKKQYNFILTFHIANADICTTCLRPKNLQFGFYLGLAA